MKKKYIISVAIFAVFLLAVFANISGLFPTDYYSVNKIKVISIVEKKGGQEIHFSYFVETIADCPAVKIDVDIDRINIFFYRVNIFFYKSHIFFYRNTRNYISTRTNKNIGFTKKVFIPNQKKIPIYFVDSDENELRAWINHNEKYK